jgi:hypothetical protein
MGWTVHELCFACAGLGNGLELAEVGWAEYGVGWTGNGLNCAWAGLDRVF